MTTSTGVFPNTLAALATPPMTNVANVLRIVTTLHPLLEACVDEEADGLVGALLNDGSCQSLVGIYLSGLNIGDGRCCVKLCSHIKISQVGESHMPVSGLVVASITWKWCKDIRML